MPTGLENPLFLMDGEKSQNSNAFPSVQCSFPMGMNFQGISLTGEKFTADFFSGEGVQTGVLLNALFSYSRYKFLCNYILMKLLIFLLSNYLSIKEHHAITVHHATWFLNQFS